MPNYRRLFIPGGMYFFMVNLLDRSSRLLTKHVSLLRGAYGAVQDAHPFQTVAIVVLPDHFHCVWRLPAEDANYSLRIRLLKERFTKRLPPGAITRTGRREGERGVWQRRFWEHAIRDDEDLNRHVDYIHFNPVRHGHVDDPDDWPHSTWHDWKKEYGRPINTPPEDWKPIHLEEA